MFFHRSNRIKTEPKIAGRLDEDFHNNKRKLKIKNIRFSFDQEIDKFHRQTSTTDEAEPKGHQQHREPVTHFRKLNFLERLPEISFEGREGCEGPKGKKEEIDQGRKEEVGQGRKEEVGPGKKEELRERNQLSMQQYKKKDALLNSILQILKPNSTKHQGGRGNENGSKQLCFDQVWRRDAPEKEYVNQFFEELPQSSTTKHQQAPKILENEVFRFKHSNSIVRRKIYSEDKDRQKHEAGRLEMRKQQSDLEKIEILTFANKFPHFRKEGDQ